MAIADPVLPVPTTAVGPVPMGEVSQLFPARGQWTEAGYFGLGTNRLVELVDGRMEVVPLAHRLHQAIVILLCKLLRAFVSADERATVLIAPFSVRLWPLQMRQPDVIHMSGPTPTANTRHIGTVPTWPLRS